MTIKLEGTPEEQVETALRKQKILAELEDQLADHLSWCTRCASGSDDCAVRHVIEETMAECFFLTTFEYPWG